MDIWTCVVDYETREAVVEIAVPIVVCNGEGHCIRSVEVRLASPRTQKW